MKPEIFNTEMVRAILDDRKTNTRRMVKVPNDVEFAWKHELDNTYTFKREKGTASEFFTVKAPHKVGDIIYVRETWSDYPQYYIWYKADFPLHWDAKDTEHGEEVHIEADNVKWKPSIHMPKEYARLFLRVKDVRIERLNEISEEDAIKEGLLCVEEDDGVWYPDYTKLGRLYKYAKSSFHTLWESIYGNGSFDNRYVWVIKFEQISKEEEING